MRSLLICATIKERCSLALVARRSVHEVKKAVKAGKSSPPGKIKIGMDCLWISHRGDCGYRFKSNCPLVSPVTIGEMPSMGVFLRDPNPHLHEFWVKLQKTPNG